MNIIDVTAAIMRNKSGRIFIARRKPERKQGGKWEFPGGKIELGETPQRCLQRELEEEFDIKVSIGKFFAENTHNNIRLLAYEAYHISGTIRLIDHDAFLWVYPAELSGLSFPPVDIPIVQKLASI